VPHSVSSVLSVVLLFAISCVDIESSPTGYSGDEAALLRETLANVAGREPTAIGTVTFGPNCLVVESESRRVSVRRASSPSPWFVESESFRAPSSVSGMVRSEFAPLDEAGGIEQRTVFVARPLQSPLSIPCQGANSAAYELVPFLPLSRLEEASISEAEVKEILQSSYDDHGAPPLRGSDMPESLTTERP
jgi:hypothetical protein